MKVANGFNQDACLGQQIKIALLGDSLTRRSFVYFDLANLILQKLQNIQSRLNYNIEYNCLAIDGSKIIDVEVTQLWPAIDWKPNATIIFWDTDISDVDEYDMPSEDVTNIRNQFQVTVNTVVNTILNHTNNTNLALSIPGILGEDQVFKPSK